MEAGMTTPPLGSSHTILAPLLGPELAERVDVGLVAASRWWRNARAKKGVFMTAWAITLLALLTGLVAVWRSDRPEILAGASESAVDIAPGVRMPLLSNGIGDQLLWLRKGGRGIDTAVLYGEDRQHEVRDAIRASGVPREQIFISANVLCCPSHRCNGFCERELRGMANDIHAQIEYTLEHTGLASLDLLSLQMPCARWRDTLAAWRALESAHARGVARSIGVSNFNGSALAALYRAARVKPSVNQCAFSIAGRASSTHT
tara:strand:- start:2582 stop:3364 length:783 start_codon:yes stop_codon:yes gene_type:complete